MNPLSNRREFLVRAAALGGVSVLGKWPLAAAEQPASAGKAESSSNLPPLAPPDRQPPNLPIPEQPARKAGWAIVGLGELALSQILPAFRESRWSAPVALVSGHPDKARKVAEDYQVSPEAIYSYENFDKVKDDPRIDVIYIVLPNSMHAEFTIRGLRAGKHVLCEKPMAVTVAECERMISAAHEAQRKLGVAYRLHHEPLTRQAMALCNSQHYGKIKTIESSNCQQTPAPNIRLSAALGGGPVGDVGVYSINAARSMTGEEPEEVFAMAQQPSDDPRFREVPESVAFILRFPSGVLAHCDCSFGATESRRFRVHCDHGYVEMDPAFSYHGLRLRTKKGEAKGDKHVEQAEWVFEEVNQFSAEMDSFSQSVLKDQPLRTPGEMGLADQKVIAAISESLRRGHPVKV